MKAGSSTTNPATIPLTWRAVRQGSAASLVYAPGYLVFGAAVGTLAAQKGLSLGDAVLMSTLVCAAAAQMVALELWTADWTFAHILAVAGVTAMVNARFILSGASLRPWLAPVRAAIAYPVLSVLTDGAWAASIRYRADGGRDCGFFIGSTLALWLTWSLASVPGYLVGALVSEPRTFALDLIVPLMFTATVTPILARTARYRAFIVSGLVALAASLLLPGYWFIVIGALAGAAAGAFSREETK